MRHAIIGLLSRRLELAHYTLNDDLATKNIVDISANGYDLTRAVENTEDRSVAGKINLAQEFTSANEYACRPALPNGDAGAVMAWCNFTPGVAGGALVSQRLAGAANIDFIITASDTLGNIRFQGTFDSTVKEIVTSTPPSGTFHVAVVWAAGNCIMYINNAFAGFFSYTDYTPAEAVGTSFCIGGRNDVSGRHLNGWLDDVRVYNTPLQASAVTKIYNGGSGTELPLSQL